MLLPSNLANTAICAIMAECVHLTCCISVPAGFPDGPREARQLTCITTTPNHEPPGILARGPPGPRERVLIHELDDAALHQHTASLR